jgi:hypothetical protein
MVNIAGFIRVFAFEQIWTLRLKIHIGLYRILDLFLSWLQSPFQIPAEVSSPSSLDRLIFKHMIVGKMRRISPQINYTLRSGCWRLPI